MRLAHVLVCHSVVPAKLLSSIPIVPDSKWYVVLHSDHVAIKSFMERVGEARECVLLPYQDNRGLARSWNEALNLALADHCEAFLILNDDLFFYDNAYLEFRETIKSVHRDPDVACVTLYGRETGASPHSGEVNIQSFACCSLTTACLERIGYFDENFFPAYFEDVDYNRRIILSRMRAHVDGRILVEHERSSTMTLMSEEEQRFMQTNYRWNEEYLTLKWGSGEKNYDRPFDCEALDLKIDFSDRESPYGAARDRKNRPRDDATYFSVAREAARKKANL